MPPRAGQLAVLRGQISRRNRRMSVRRLMERIPNLLLTLKPCFLMSPLAVSQYLPGGQPGGERIEFDVLIFDEASQVWPEEALPAIERARQVIVAGDRQQLPPSRFFRSTGSDNEGAEDEDDGPEDAFAGRESILDAMVGQLGRNVGESWLGVHYRSRCESLIRFSNHAFYENRLLTFPGPSPDEVCVRSVYLDEATYDRGGSRTNRVEAERVAEIVFDLMQTTPPSESLGVVALSRPQADLIELLIEERRLLERHLDDRFSEDRVEHFFVKNLENVQGDERDHMILSVGFGPTPAGAVPNNFGPINQERGERRLNVAVTRARQSMTVVHSIRPDQIRSQGAGARMLRRYLEFAANPTVAFEAEVSGTGEPESPFEEAVLAALRSQGHQAESQIGVSGYRIDLGIRSEDGDGFDLGIECDGATYHSSPAARDRDWLRQQVLERLGWRIHRVWSTSWIRNPQGELAAIEQALKRARAEPTKRANVGERPIPSPLVVGDEKDRVDAPRIGIVDTSAAQDSSSQFEEYERFSYSGPVLDPFSLALSDLASLVRQIVEVEQPVHVETVFERLRTGLGIPRLSSNVRMRLASAIRESVDGGEVARDPDRFLRLAQGGLDVRPRCDGSRKISRVSDVELDAGLLAVARATFGVERADLVRMTARQFGYGHTGTNIAARLEQRVDDLLEVGRLSEQSGTLVATQSD